MNLQKYAIIFAIILATITTRNNIGYDEVTVDGEKIATDSTESDQQSSEIKVYKKKSNVKSLAASDDSYLTVEHLGLFEPNDVDDVLTVPNYDDYYDESNDILKTAIVNKFIQNKAPFSNGNLSDSLLADVADGNTENKIDIYDTYFPVTTSGSNNDKHVMMFNYWNSDKEWHVSNITIPNCPSDLVIVDGVFISRSEFEADSMSFQVNNNGYADYTYDGHNSLNDAIHLDTTDNLYKMDYHKNSMFAYSDIPIYFIYADIEGIEDDYLQETYHYQNYMDVYNAIGNDDSGFVIDRRLNTGIGAPETDHNLGFVDGSFYNLFGGASKDNMQMLVLYEMNNYTKSRRNSLKLCQDYTFQVDGTVLGQSLAYSGNYLLSRGTMDEYDIGASNYLQVNLTKILNGSNIRQFDTDLFDRIIDFYALRSQSQGNTFFSYEDIQNCRDGEVSPVMLLGYLIDAGFTGSSQVYDGFYESHYKGQIEGTLSVGLKKEFGVKWNIDSQNTSHREWYTDELRVCKLTVRQYLEDKVSGDSSPVNIWEYNFLTGEVTNNNALVKDNTDENDEVIPWDGTYPYGVQPQPLNPVTPIVNPAQTLNPNIYPTNNNAQGGQGGNASAQGGSGGNSNVTVNVGGGELAVIDYPYEVVTKVMPNVTSLFNTMKTQIVECKEGSQSVFALTKDVYSMFPPQVWTWVLTGVSFTFGTAIYYNWRTGGRH